MLTLPVPSLEGLRTERLLFRRPTMADHSWWMEYHNNAEAIRYMPFSLGSEADCRQFIQWTLDRIPRDGTCLNAILEKESLRPVAMIGLLTQEVEGTTELEIGYHVLPSAWGKGYATEAALATRAYAYDTLGWTTAISLILDGNDRSAALAARLGCVREGGFTHAQFGATSIWRHPAPDAQGAGMEAYA